MHWADVAARNIRDSWDGNKEVLLATGITPSGPIHIGNMREILTAELVHRALDDLGVKNKLVYVSDTFDPLRKRYPFLDENYDKYIGWPLSRIPCPCGNHENYAEHFLEPFLKVLDKLGVDIEVIRMHKYYEEGHYAEAIDKVMQARDRIRSILIEISGRELPEDWYPYNAVCEKCGSMTETKVKNYEFPYVEYTCRCGHEGKADIRKASGKLPWRVDWPARWWSLRVDFEPFGKDHAASGGSYETGSAIIREVFGSEPPSYVVYEWIQLKGKGAMSSSKGIAVSAEEMVSITPPEVLRFLIAKYEPKTHIDFDPGLALLNLVDEYDRYERVYYGMEEMGGKDIADLKRIYELANLDRGNIKGDALIQVPMRHAVTLVQLYRDEGLLVEKLTGRKPEDLDERTMHYVRSRINSAREWLARFAPENVKFTLVEDSKELEGVLSEEDREILKGLADALEGTSWEAEKIQNAVFEYANASGLPPKKVFAAAYRAFLKKDRGPKMGFFLSTLDRDFVLGRLKGDW